MNNIILGSTDFLPVNPAQWAPWLILLGLTMAIFIPSSIVCKKTGLHSSSSTICLIPIIGPLIFFWIVAFSKWPIHDKLPDPEEQDSKEEKANESMTNTTTTTTKRRMKKRKKR